MRVGLGYALVLLTEYGTASLQAQTAATTTPQSSKTVPSGSQEAIDHDLYEVPIPQLEAMYRSHRYTVTEVVQWYLGRIARYNGIYRAIENVDARGALAAAAHEDAEAKAGGNNFERGPMWGVPIVTKENTSVRGLITTDGWKGYTIPGHEL